MKVYILVNKNQNTLSMPVTFGRSVRVYDSKARAKVYGRKFNCTVVELDVEKGKVVHEESSASQSTL